MCLSVVIPALNEAATVCATLASIPKSSDLEVIVVDGGSQDATVELARSFGVRVLASAKGRARQMNAGARAATGELLLFLHADTRLPEGFEASIRQALSQNGTAAGAFRLRLDAPLLGLRLIECLANWRSRHLQMPYGDQGIFLRAELFHALGGFADLSIMEDFELMQRLRQRGRVVTLPLAVVSSARRWQSLGVWKTTLMNQAAIVAYCWGVEPSRIAGWYKGGPEVSPIGRHPRETKPDFRDLQP
jgi:rSAM/selenodomain-associated transferase 2